MVEQPLTRALSRARGRAPSHLPLLLVIAAAAAYEAVLLLTSAAGLPYRFPTPFAIPIFDTPFALVAIGVGYLCLERHRLRQDLESSAIGITLWLTALLAFAHILAQPDYPVRPGVNPGIAPYFFFASFFIGLAGIGLAAHHGDRPLPLTDRARFSIGAGVLAFSVVFASAILLVQPYLPSPVMPPGRFTPFVLWAGGGLLGAFAVWVFWGGRRRFFSPERDAFATYLLLASVIWMTGLMGLLTSKGFRYSIPWYLAGLARPLGVGIVFFGLLREQVWLYREARARQFDLESLHAAGQALVKSLDPRQIAETVAAKAVEVSGSDAAILFRLDTGAQVVRAVSYAGGISQQLVADLELPVGQGAWGLAIAGRQPVWTPNLQPHPTVPFPASTRARMERDGLKAVIAIPLLGQSGEVFGALTIFYRSAREFGDADVGLLSAFGTQASVAIENGRSFDQLALKARRDEALHAFAQRLLEAIGEEEIVQDAAGVTRDLVAADGVGVFLFDRSMSALHLAAAIGWPQGTDGSVTVAPSDESFAGYTFLRRQTVQVENLASEGRFPASADLVASGIQACIGTPLGVREQPLGVLVACYRAPHRFNDEESRALTSLAHQTALALEKVRLYAELQTHLRQLSEMQAQLIQADKLKALGTLLSGMAHELNNPLSVIQLSIQLMKGEVGLPEPVRRRIDDVEKACERAARIIRELLVFARRRPPERRRVDLNEVARAALSLQTPEFGLNKIRVVTQLSPLPSIWADASQLQQVLLNLFSNATDAIKKARGAGTLTVRSRERADGVMVEVEDDGPGISPEHLHRVFDPFFTTKGVGEGTGLGLSLSLGIVEAHGGSLRAEGIPGAGARFTLTLPLGTAVEAPEAAEVAPMASRPRARILVVEDEAPLRAILADIFIGFGHDVDQAETGQAARDQLARNTYDVVTLDLKLPDIDGKTVWRWITEQRPDLAARVIFVTGDTMSAETQAFLDEAGRPVLNKPLAIQQIAGVVDAMLTAPPSPPS